MPDTPKAIAPLTPLPEPPSRKVANQARFDDLAYQSLKGQQQMVTEINAAFIPAVNNAVTTAFDAATKATLKATESAASATTATTKATEAGTAATAAATSANTARTAETAALASKNAAAGSATAAKASETSAAASALRAEDIANIGDAGVNKLGFVKMEAMASDGSATAAPGGFGVGVKKLPIISNLDDNNLPTGFYQAFGGSTTGTRPTGINANYAIIRHMKRDGASSATQLFYDHTTGGNFSIFKRDFMNGATAWTAWNELPSGFDGVPVNGKAAPGGYGLGRKGESIENLNTAVSNGFYGVRAETVVNGPPQLTGSNLHGAILVARGGHHVAMVNQLYFSWNGRIFYRRSIDGNAVAWNPWIELPSGITDSTSTTSSSISASATAVKAAYDKAVSAKANADYATNAGSVKMLYDQHLMGPRFNTYEITGYGHSGTGTASLYVNATCEGVIKSSVLLVAASHAVGQFRPDRDNYLWLGDPGQRWTQLYSASGSISTSDEREKELVNITGYISDAMFRAWSRVHFCQYQMKDAIFKKGETARVHCGVIAQRVKEAFEAENLDPFHYGLLCYDTWDAEEEITETYIVEVSPAVYEDQIQELSPAYTDENGTEWPAQTITESVMVKEAITEERTRVLQPAREAGDRYALRYEECLCLEAAYQRWRADKMEARLATTESRLNDLKNLETRLAALEAQP